MLFRDVYVCVKKFVTIDISSSRWVNCISTVISVVRVSKRTESLTMYRQSEYNLFTMRLSQVKLMFLENPFLVQLERSQFPDGVW